MRILELSGLVRHEVNRCAVVISPTPEKVEALYTARERLETAAVSRPAGESELAALRTAYDELVEAAASHEVLRIVDVDLAFHSAIVSMLHSTRLDEFYAELMVELRFYLTVLSLEDREFEHPDDILAEHRVILEAIESGDTATAVQQAGHRDPARPRVTGRRPARHQAGRRPTIRRAKRSGPDGGSPDPPRAGRGLRQRRWRRTPRTS